MIESCRLRGTLTKLDMEDGRYGEATGSRVLGGASFRSHPFPRGVPEAARHHGRSSGHDYRFEDTGLDLAEHRALVAEYQEQFGVVSEVV